MSIFIKGMEMPKACGDCGCYDDVYQCGATGNTVRYEGDPDGNIGWDERPNWCPLVEVPTPHGRLIDEDSIPVCMTLEEEAKMVAVIEAEE